MTSRSGVTSTAGEPELPASVPLIIPAWCLGGLRDKSFSRRYEEIDTALRRKESVELNLTAHIPGCYAKLNFSFVVTSQSSSVSPASPDQAGYEEHVFSGQMVADELFGYTARLFFRNGEPDRLEVTPPRKAASNAG